MVQQLLKKAAALHSEGKFQEAANLYQQAIQEQPDYPVPYNLTGVIATQVKRADIAENMFKRALALEPNYQEAHYNYGNLLYEEKRYKEAVEHFRAVPKNNPIYAGALNNMANALREDGDIEGAIAIYEKIIEHQPDFTEVWENLGKALTMIGRIEDAKKASEQAVVANPLLVDSHLKLSRIHDYNKDDTHLKQMTGLLKGELTDHARAVLNFALGNAYNKLKRYDDAFLHFSEGNRLHRASCNYTIEKDRAFFVGMQNAFGTFPPNYPWDEGCADDTPIFILGMPRSGTSLIEQILASHPKVYGAGEIALMLQIVTEQMSADEGMVTAEKKKQLGAEYVRRLRELAPAGISHITPKMPDNFKLIGYIALLLPKARIIHCVRDPIDTCLSQFFQFFSEAHPYAYNLSEVGQYYKLYSELMAFWKQLLPNRIYDVHYDDVVGNFEPTVRNLLEHCGLEWDERCLDFHKTERVVRTASDVQVRQPIYRTSLNMKERYGAHLAPLYEALGIEQ